MPEVDERLIALQGLIHRNSDLEQLEALAGRFNPFTAMGWTRQEIRHSAFLRWFLDPQASHGLGVYPLRAFLKEVLASRGVVGSPTVFDAEIWDLAASAVLTEWQRIDVLIRNDEERFVIVVENKLHSSEHSGQLKRYRELVSGTFGDYAQAYVYLTPSGDPPTDELYEPLAYSAIADLVDRVVDARRLQLSDEVRTFLEQYAELVRRYIVEDSEIQELCRRLYEKHRVAFDLIYEHRPDRALEVSEALQRTIASRADLTPDQSSKTYIRFSTPVLDRFPRIADGWTKSGRLILFEFENSRDEIALKLVLGPGPDDVRARIRDGIVAQAKVFNRAGRRFGTQWWSFHRMAWLPRKSYLEKPIDEMEAELAAKLATFVEQDLPSLEAGLELLLENVR